MGVLNSYENGITMGLAFSCATVESIIDGEAYAVVWGSFDEEKVVVVVVEVSKEVEEVLGDFIEFA